MKTDELGFLYPNINQSMCVNCGMCEKVCSICFQSSKTTVQRKAFSAFNKNDIVRKNSSSGGVFSSIAEFIIKTDGLVVGAAFDGKFEKVKHIIVDDIYNLYKIRGSKYTQSNMCSIYETVKTNLQAGKNVLFSGTPCQIYAIKNYLGKEYKNLYLVEIACHGVPSPFVWEQYLQHFKKNQKANVIDVQFRYKNPSWERYYMKISFENDKQYLKKRIRRFIYARVR